MEATKIPTMQPSTIRSRFFGHQQDRLAQAAHPWQVTRGPMAALQRYLLEKGWKATSFQEWNKDACNGAPELRIHLNDAWPTIKAELKRAESTVIVCFGLQPEARYKKSNNLLIGCPGNACRRRSTSTMLVHSRHGTKGPFSQSSVMGWKGNISCAHTVPDQHLQYTYFGCARRQRDIFQHYQQKISLSWNMA